MTQIAMTSMGSAAPGSRGSWLGRNWKWLLPLGCLLLIIVPVGGCAGFVALLMGGMKSSDAYQLAWNQARSAPEVTAELGEPVEEGWWLSGSINVNGSGGQADIQFPISGPKGKATVHCQATRSAGKWQAQQLVVVIEGSGRKIYLLAPETPPEAPPGSP
jgi:hypothetical protein